MEEQANFDPGSFKEVKFEDDEEEFRSCCEDEDELKEREESAKESSKDDLDEFSVKMFFKGVSMANLEDSGSSGLSGIGVFMVRSAGYPIIQVQKKLDFYVEESVADYLALMDGLSEALRNDVKHVQAFTNSEVLFNQITRDEMLESPLLVALRQRIIEHANSLNFFGLKYVPDIDIKRPLWLAQIAIGIVSFPAKGDESVENCSICCEEKLAPMMITMKCSHKFCSHCMKTYVDGKVQSSQVPIRCPQTKCRYYISTTECRSFLPVTSYELLERALTEANVLNSDKLYCPFPNCSVLLDPCECLSARASSSSESSNSCLECPVCQRFICVECVVPWHCTMTCEEYQSLPLEERDAGDITLHRLAQNKRWRRCQQCRRMIELTHGCYHMTCWCGHEFCYSCGAEYRDAQQTCQCAFWDEEYSEDVITHPSQQFEQWAWDSFGSLSTMMDAYKRIICFETLNPTHKNNASDDGDGAESKGSKLTELVSSINLAEYSANSALHKSPVVCKPFEIAFEEAVKIAEINPEKTLFFDDSIRNLQTASRIGLQTVLVGSSHHTKGVDYALESIHNIREALPELWEALEKSERVRYTRKAAIETVVRA